MAESLTLTTADGVTLEAEIACATDPQAFVVLCHPHPVHGGTMRSLVISELFAALTAAGISCVRFNFRGVGASAGSYDAGNAEREDVRAALRAAPTPELPCVLAGWSFGADLALSVTDSEIEGWIAIAPPLRYAHDLDVIGADVRPKLVILAEHDEFRPADEARSEVADWQSCETRTMGGASHFFVGRTDRLVAAVLDWLDRTI